MEIEWKVPPVWNAIERNRARSYAVAYNAMVNMENWVRAMDLWKRGNARFLLHSRYLRRVNLLVLVSGELGEAFSHITVKSKMVCLQITKLSHHRPSTHALKHLGENLAPMRNPY